MSAFGKELIESLTEAAAHAHGQAVAGMRVNTVEAPDVKAIRQALHMSSIASRPPSGFRWRR